MFTGIIEELGKVASLEMQGDNARVVISAATVVEGMNGGDSIAVNGVCLTALDIKAGSFAAEGCRHPRPEEREQSLGVERPAVRERDAL